MKKNLLIIFILTLFISVILSGCSEETNSLTDEEQRFIGTWFAGGPINDVVAFYPDGTCCHFLDMSGVWKIEDGKLIIIVNDGEYIYNYEFSAEDQSLTLSSQDGTQSKIFRKQ